MKNQKVFDVPNHKETFVAVESDKEASSAKYNYYTKIMLHLRKW
jgi:hypothetical protein